MSSQLNYALDSQILSSMQSCLEHYRLRFELGHRVKSGPIYWDRGALLHVMLAEYYKLKKYRDRWQLNRKTYRDIVNICVTVGRHKSLGMTNIDPAEIERTIEVFLEYTDFWENEDLRVYSIEKVYSKVLHEDPNILILYEGKPDLVVSLSHSDSKQIMPIDHKHTAQRRDADRLLMSNQMRSYCWLLGCNNITINEVGFQTTVAPKDKFRRQMLSYSDTQIEEWRENSIQTVLHTLELRSKGIELKNYTSCISFNGGKTCEFFPVCSSDREIRPYKLEDLYEIQQWDVGSKEQENM